MRVVCKIQHGVLTMSIPPPTSDRLQVLPPPPGTASTASAASGPYSSHLSE